MTENKLARDEVFSKIQMIKPPRKKKKTNNNQPPLPIPQITLIDEQQAQQTNLQQTEIISTNVGRQLPREQNVSIYRTLPKPSSPARSKNIEKTFIDNKSLVDTLNLYEKGDITDLDLFKMEASIIRAIKEMLTTLDRTPNNRNML